MEFNLITTGIELVGTTIKKISIENNIVDVEREAKRCFGLNINEPIYKKADTGFFSQMTIDFNIKIEQNGGQICNIMLSIEGAFISTENTEEKTFKQDQKSTRLNSSHTS